MSFPRVLVVTGSAGYGHVRAAQALAAALRARHPRLDVAELDALDAMPAGYRRFYRRAYVRLVDRWPLVWRALYEATDRETSALGHAVNVAAGGGLVRRALAWRPDLVVCTHFLAPELLSRAVRKGRTSVPLHLVVTDHDAHRVWWHPEVSAYYVASDLVKARLVHRFGARAERVTVTGIPVAAPFAARRDPAVLRSKVGLDPARPAVLFLSAGFAAGRVADAIRGVWADRPDVQVVAVCGKNARLARSVSSIPRPSGGVLQVHGFTTEVAELMGACDLVVGKSGGVTTSECMALGKPFVVSASIAGQEERNADAAVAGGGAVRALSPEEVRWHVVRLLSRPDDLRAMAAKARAFGRPQAADSIADRVAEALGAAPVWSPPAHGARATVPR